MKPDATTASTFSGAVCCCCCRCCLSTLLASQNTYPNSASMDSTINRACIAATVQQAKDRSDELDRCGTAGGGSQRRDRPGKASV